MYKMPFTKTYCFFFNHSENCVRFVLHLMCFFLPLVSTRLLMSTTSSRYCINQKYSVKLFLYIFLLHVYQLLYTNMTPSHMIKILQLFALFFQIMYMYLILIVCRFLYFTRNVFFLGSYSRGTLSFLSALACKKF